MINRFGMAITILLAVTPLQPARAQDAGQTVEGAQRFLSIVLPGSHYVPGAVFTGLAHARAADTQGVTNRLEGRVPLIEAGVVSRCMSRLLFDISQLNVVMTYRGEKQSVNVATLFGGMPLPGNNKEGFHWGKDVVGARQVGHVIYLKFQGSQHESELYLGDEAMAKRVIYAINFLRLECDPAAATGF